ncbi:hypothetical protein [Peterkaempfera sp. SMS 1(5)a]|uniref:hypothetical protein n=1 Tax=Peterkaempfera podocarpi TaxID=3232308 RepID=UPI003670012B
MFYLRLAQGYRVLDLGRWILTAAASAAAAAMLLRALGRALVDPPGTTVAVSEGRLLWCLPSLAAICWLCACCARALPSLRPDRVAGLTAAGAGPARRRLLIAGETAIACVAGSLLALLGFLVLRNNIAGTTLAPEVGMGARLPAAAPLTLLLVVPLLGALAAAGAVPGRERLPEDTAEPDLTRLGPLRTVAAPAAALIGAALVVYGPHAPGRHLHAPARLGTTTAITSAGWAVAVLGLVLTVPLLLSWAGLLLGTWEPTATRLLAGRGLQAEAVRLGAPLGVLAVTAAVVAAAAERWTSTGHGPGGPLPAVEAALLGACALATVGVRVAESRAARGPSLALVRRLGTPASVLRTTALTRVGAAAAAVLPVGVAAAGLTLLAFHR